jgi:hypothetical protein
MIPVDRKNHASRQLFATNLAGRALTWRGEQAVVSWLICSQSRHGDLPSCTRCGTEMREILSIAPIFNEPVWSFTSARDAA